MSFRCLTTTIQFINHSNYSLFFDQTLVSIFWSVESQDVHSESITNQEIIKKKKKQLCFSQTNWKGRINQRTHLKFRLFVNQNYHKSWKQKYFLLHFFFIFFLKKSFECLLWARVVEFLDRKQYNCLFSFIT